MDRRTFFIFAKRKVSREVRCEGSHSDRADVGPHKPGSSASGLPDTIWPKAGIHNPRKQRQRRATNPGTWTHLSGPTWRRLVRHSRTIAHFRYSSWRWHLCRAIARTSSELPDADNAPSVLDPRPLLEGWQSFARSLAEMVSPVGAATPYLRRIVNAAFDPACRRRRPRTSTPAAASVPPIARAPSSPRTAISLKRNQPGRPAAAAPALAGRATICAAPESSATPRQGIKITSSPAGNVEERARRRPPSTQLLKRQCCRAPPPSSHHGASTIIGAGPLARA
jgi:hypothetical protein